MKSTHGRHLMSGEGVDQEVDPIIFTWQERFMRFVRRVCHFLQTLLPW